MSDGGRAAGGGPSQAPASAWTSAPNSNDCVPRSASCTLSRPRRTAGLLTSHGLPRVGALLPTFGPSISSAVAGFIHGQVHKIVTSSQFARVWVQANTTVSLAALLFVFWGRPTAAVVVVIAILLLVVLGLIGLIGSRPPAQPATAAHP